MTKWTAKQKQEDTTKWTAKQMGRSQAGLAVTGVIKED
jgi:hypothetical protein